MFPKKRHQVNIYLLVSTILQDFKVCLTIWRRSVVFIANLEHISHISAVSIVDFEQVNVCWGEWLYLK